MNRLAVAAIGGLALLASVFDCARAEVTAEQVRAAIERGVGYLLGQQCGDGSWPEIGEYPAGVSAACTLALIDAGVQKEDNRMRRALDYLRRARPQKTYVVALQTMVFARAEPERDRQRILQRPKAGEHPGRRWPGRRRVELSL
jgi:hypothetical protein